MNEQDDLKLQSAERSRVLLPAEGKDSEIAVAVEDDEKNAKILCDRAKKIDHSFPFPVCPFLRPAKARDTPMAPGLILRPGLFRDFIRPKKALSGCPAPYPTGPASQVLPFPIYSP